MGTMYSKYIISIPVRLRKYNVVVLLNEAFLSIPIVFFSKINNSS